MYDAPHLGFVMLSSCLDWGYGFSQRAQEEGQFLGGVGLLMSAALRNVPAVGTMWVPGHLRASTLMLEGGESEEGVKTLLGAAGGGSQRVSPTPHPLGGRKP